MPYKNPDDQRAYQREWLARRRARYIQPCSQCGSAEQPEIHHLDRDGKESHKIWSWSRDRLEAELAKCVWLCKPCHDRLHTDERAAIDPRRLRDERGRYRLDAGG